MVSNPQTFRCPDCDGVCYITGKPGSGPRCVPGQGCFGSSADSSLARSVLTSARSGRLPLAVSSLTSTEFLPIVPWNSIMIASGGSATAVDSLFLFGGIGDRTHR
jgi:hypothetical protein